MPSRDKIFVSYSHKDRKLFHEFKTMIAPAIQQDLLDFWDDERIPPGAAWKEEIKKALASARIAVLLVSQNFLASRFIVREELKPLLQAAREEGVMIFWIFLSSCLYEHTEIASYQALHDISKPLDRLSKAQRQAVLSHACAKLIQAAKTFSKPQIEVDPNNPECNTVMAAVRMAGTDYRVLVKEGIYRESVVIDKPIEIVGQGDRKKVIIESTNRNAILFEAAHGRIANLTIRNVGTEHSAVKITKGRLELEDCDITNRGLSCVSIQHDAQPVVRRNDIHDGRQEGIYAGEGAGGVIEDNRIYRNRLAGVAIWRGASPRVRGNEIFECKEGIYIGDRGRGEIVNNRIHDNRGPGIKTEGGEPTLGPNEEYRNNLGGP